MNKDDKKRVKRNIFISETKRKSKEEIREKEAKLGRKLTNNEKDQIVLKNGKRMLTRIGAIAVAGAFGIGILAGGAGVKKLNESSAVKQNKQKIEIDANKTNKNIEINTAENSKRDIFINGIKVELNEIDNNESLEQSTEKEVNQLANDEEVLNYLKSTYIDKYNEEHQKGLSEKNVSIYKTRLQELQENKDKNGNKYFTTNFAKQKEGATDYGVINVTIKDGNRIAQDEYAIYDEKTNSYIPVYDDDEKIDEVNSNPMYGLGAVLDNGIDYYATFSKTDNNKETYKNRFITSIEKYKQSQIDKINGKKSQTEGKNNSNIKEDTLEER